MSGARMSADGPGDDDTPNDVLAGEYVLGLLDAEAARVVEARAGREPALAACIASWQDRLDPLADMPAPQTPGDALWPRIVASLNQAPSAHAAASGRRRRPDPVAVLPARQGPWRAIALTSLAVAACLAAFIVWSGPGGDRVPVWPRATALLSVPGSAIASLRAQVTGSGTITVVPLRHLDVPADHRLGFWAWPATEKAPVLLGMLAAQGGQLRFPYAAKEGTPVMVTLEAAAGAVGSKPGQTLYLGLLVANPG